MHTATLKVQTSLIVPSVSQGSPSWQSTTRPLLTSVGSVIPCTPSSTKQSDLASPGPLPGTHPKAAHPGSVVDVTLVVVVLGVEVVVVVVVMGPVVVVVDVVLEVVVVELVVGGCVVEVVVVDVVVVGCVVEVVVVVVAGTVVVVVTATVEDVVVVVVLVLVVVVLGNVVVVDDVVLVVVVGTVVVVTCVVDVVLVVVVVVVTGQFTQHGRDGVSWSVAAGWMTACAPIVGGVLLYWSRFCVPALRVPEMVIEVPDWTVFVPAGTGPGPRAEMIPVDVTLTVHPERSVAPPPTVPSVMTEADTVSVPSAAASNVPPLPTPPLVFTCCGTFRLPPANRFTSPPNPNAPVDMAKSCFEN